MALTQINSICWQRSLQVRAGRCRRLGLCVGYSSILKNKVILLLPIIIIMIVIIYWLSTILWGTELNVMFSFLRKGISLFSTFYRWGYLVSDVKWLATAAWLVHSRAKTRAKSVQVQSPFLSIPLSSLQGVSVPFPLSVMWSLDPSRQYHNGH